jgi:hypothetical protein
VPLAPGDVLLLCSDGLWSPLSGKIISSAILKDGIMQAVPGLLDEAERRAGRECDNLSAIAMRWEEQPAGTQSEQIPAERTPPQAYATQAAEAGAAQNEYLSDDEIERAIARIRNAIKRQTDDKT